MLIKIKKKKKAASNFNFNRKTIQMQWPNTSATSPLWSVPMCSCAGEEVSLQWTLASALLSSLKWLARQGGTTQRFSGAVNCPSLFSNSHSKEHWNKTHTCHYLISFQYPLTFPYQLFASQLLLFQFAQEKNIYPFYFKPKRTFLTSKHQSMRVYVLRIFV